MKLTKTVLHVPRLINTYVMTINSYTGDADDYHSFDLHYKLESDLRNVIIAYSIMSNCYPHGRCSRDRYIGKYFEEYFQDELHYDCNYDTYDTFYGYTIKYHDENGAIYSVDVEFDDEMEKEILHPNLSDEELKRMKYKPLK
jgi:hypothetical protein